MCIKTSRCKNNIFGENGHQLRSPGRFSHPPHLQRGGKGARLKTHIRQSRSQKAKEATSSYVRGNHSDSKWRGELTQTLLSPPLQTQPQPPLQLPPVHLRFPAPSTRFFFLVGQIACMPWRCKCSNERRNLCKFSTPPKPQVWRGWRRR